MNQDYVIVGYDAVTLPLKIKTLCCLKM